MNIHPGLDPVPVPVRPRLGEALVALGLLYGRDDWAMFSDHPSAVVVATARNGRSVELGSAVGHC